MTDRSPLPLTETARRLRLMPIRTALAWTIGGAVALLLVVTAAAFLVLGWPGVQRKSELTVDDLFNVLKMSFAVTAGLGAIVALVMAYRRQRVAEAANELAEAANQLAEATQEHRRQVDEANRTLQQEVAASTRYDAAERRVTELYTKAADQLGSAKAPVRFAGIYALERLAQGSPEHRQTIVNLLCAYLRMPFTPPPEQLTGQQAESRYAIEAEERFAGRREEREVRLTAQRVLIRHLRRPAAPDDQAAPGDQAPPGDQAGPAGRLGDEAPESEFWPDLDLDLARATLVDLDFRRAAVRRAIFTGATFHGVAGFDDATFADSVSFAGATFDGPVRFVQAAFDGTAHFEAATFRGEARFERATFTQAARFEHATFDDDAWFRSVRFDGDTWFEEVTARRITAFDKSTFARIALFRKAVFGEDTSFTGAAFQDAAWFRATAFQGDAGFRGTEFHGHAGFRAAAFQGSAQFEQATFFGSARFDDATLHGPAYFDQARIEGDDGHLERIWPTGWSAGPDPDQPGRTRLTPTTAEPADPPAAAPEPEPEPAPEPESAPDPA